jgi:hypothetical protein
MLSDVPPHGRFDNGGGASAPVAPLTSSGGAGGKGDRRITLAMIKEEGLGTNNAPSYVQVSPCSF